MDIEFIIGEKPPNWSILEDKFGVKWGNVVVTYGNKVYSSSKITPDLVVHESIHVKQQGAIPTWWEQYLEDPTFRLEQELEAYKEQVKWGKKNIKDRNKQFRFVSKLAQDLSGSMYGNCIGFNEAYLKLA